MRCMQMLRNGIKHICMAGSMSFIQTMPTLLHNITSEAFVLSFLFSTRNVTVKVRIKSECFFNSHELCWVSFIHNAKFHMKCSSRDLIRDLHCVLKCLKERDWKRNRFTMKFWKGKTSQHAYFSYHYTSDTLHCRHPKLVI